MTANIFPYLFSFSFSFLFKLRPTSRYPSSMQELKIRFRWRGSHQCSTPEHRAGIPPHPLYWAGTAGLQHRARPLAMRWRAKGNSHPVGRSTTRRQAWHNVRVRNVRGGTLSTCASSSEGRASKATGGSPGVSGDWNPAG